MSLQFSDLDFELTFLRLLEGFLESSNCVISEHIVFSKKFVDNFFEVNNRLSFDLVLFHVDVQFNKQILSFDLVLFIFNLQFIDSLFESIKFVFIEDFDFFDLFVQVITFFALDF
jgi:hypothetical protein